LSGNSGSLNVLQPSGPVQACIGTALLFLHCMVMVISKDRYPN
jgi:hypothetical protein